MKMSSGKWRSWSVIAGACIAIGLIATIYLLFAIREGSASSLTMEEARSEVLKQYDGEIIESSAHNGGFLLRLKTEQGMYEVTVSGEKGNVDGIRLLERFDGDDGSGGLPDSQGASPALPEVSPAPPTLAPAPSEAPGKDSSVAPTTLPTPVASPSSAPAPTVPIKPPTRNPDGKPSSPPSVHITEEKAAALALAKVAGKVTDVEKDDDNGVWYYYVEIYTNDGREAEVQLNAASGNILSVSWDDDDDDKDADDD